MMLAALGKTLLKGKAKKIAKDKLLNRKKKTNKRRMSVKKVMGMDDKPKKGGALAVRPTMDLGGNIKDFDPVSDTSGESDIVIIRKQVIQVRDILKDSYTAKKEEREEERKARQTEKREKREEELEKPKVKPKESKGKMPNLKLGIGNFLSWLVFGLVVNKLLELMPQLRKIFSWLKPIANFIGGLFKATIGFVVGFIDLSYAGVEKLEEAMEAIGGEGGKKLFERFGKLFTQVINGALIAAMIGGRLGLLGPIAKLLGFGKGAAATTAATTATTSTAATAGGIGAGAAAGVVAGAGLLASGLGEGIFQLGEKGYNIEADWREKADKKWWTDPRKYWWGISAGLLGVLNRGWSLLGGILDIVGAPFRMIIELIRFPFLSKEGKEKQRKNLVKYDTRIREQFRKALNIFDIFGLISDDQGSWGSLYGDVASKKASKEMGFEKKKEKIKTNTKTKTTTSSDSIKYTVKRDKVDPSSLEKGVPLVKAQQHYLQGQVEKLQFKIKLDKRRYGEDSDTSAMEKKLNQYKSRYNDTLEFGQRYNVKGDVKNIVPLDVNSVKRKTSDVSMKASYEDPEGETVLVKVPDESSFPFTEKGKESLTPAIVGGGGGDDEVSDALYKGG